LFLATRRLARSRSAALGIVGASAVAAGVLGYSATLTRSLEATLDAKARTFVGSDVVAVLADGEVLPPSLAGRATEVRVFRSARLGERRPTEVKVLAVDPATFARGAFWDETMAGPPLDEILDRLAAPASGRPAPVVVVGLDAGATTELRLDGGGAEGVTVEPVAELDAFPGMARTTPTVVIDRDALEGARGGAVETFVAGDPRQILDALADAGVTFQQDRVVADVVDRAAFVTVTWTFGYMQTLGVAAGLLVAVGLAVHVDARRRSRVLGYAFARRMGLSRRAHRTALLLELLAMVSVGSCVGLACAYLGAAVAHGRIDPVPGFAPDPLLRPDLVVGAAVALGSVVVAAVGAVVAQRLADRDDPVEVLRAGV
ncbi:MAG TPA: hypothetical protein VJM49_21575, partial [Acidimicrobiales bacterium]|nr:hypothetical protein [Acidimicrobiales bacterium]